MLKFSGKSVLAGVAIGKLYIFKKQEYTLVREIVADAEAEVARFQDACEKAKEQLGKLYEKTLEEAAVRYYQLNQTELPTGKRVATVTMQTLYHKSYLKEDFYIPYTDKPCDLKESWVKVRKVDGEYKYYTYLQCGAIKSTVDNKGPEIKLNGSEKMTIDLGSKYKDPGVKSVVDNTDGKMNVKDVNINSKKVDTEKIGTYKVTYTATDGLKNKTTVERTVEVVSKIKNAVKKANNKKDFYQGSSPNNFVRLSGMLFRIIGIDGNNVRIVADEDIANVNYSGITAWLDDYYMKHINENSKKLLVENKYCNMNVTNETLKTTKCTSFTEKRYVYIPSIVDINLTKDEKANSFMKPETLSWVANSKDDKSAYTTRNVYFGNEAGSDFYADLKTQNYGVRPVLTIKGSTLIKSGDGSASSPYTFGETKTGKTDELINTRYSGEYISYGGMLWRIVEVNDDGTTKVVSVENIKKTGQNIKTSYIKVSGKKVVYNPKQKNNVGYYINNKVSEYIDTSYFVNKEIKVPVYKKEIQYGKQKKTETYKVKLSAPNMYEMFSSRATSISGTRSYWLINSSETEDYKAAVTDAGVVVTEDVYDYDNYGIRVVGNLKKSVSITKGKGTKEKPYNITN